jgi:hypothetical protein
LKYKIFKGSGQVPVFSSRWRKGANSGSGLHDEKSGQCPTLLVGVPGFFQLYGLKKCKPNTQGGDIFLAE